MQRRITIGAVIAALAGIAVFIALLGLAGGSQAGSPKPAYRAVGGGRPAATATITARRTALGTVLADGRGRTLYLFERDPEPTSACDSACSTVWPPLDVTAPPSRGTMSPRRRSPPSAAPTAGRR